MVWPAIIAAAGALGGSLLNNMNANRSIEKENERIDAAIKDLTYDPMDYYTDYAYYDNPLLYDLYQQGNTEYNNINVDPTTIEAQNRALEELINLSEAKGLNAIDQQALEEIISEENRNLQAQNDAIAQEAMQRGVYGSGLELAQRLQAAQSGANRMSSRDMDVMRQAQQRALEALSSYGNLASSMRSQDYNEQAQRAAAQDAINRYNTQQTTDWNRGNVDNQNQVNQMNTDVQHKQQDSNVQAARDIFGNKTDIAALQTGQYNSNKEDARKRADSNNNLLGNLATAVGSAFGSSSSSK